MAGVLGNITKDQWAAMQNARRRKARRAVEPEPSPPGPPGVSAFEHPPEGYGDVLAESTPVTVGTVMVNTVPGTYTHISFFKTAGDVANARDIALYDLTGEVLATASTTGEPAGPLWITVELDTPVHRDGGNPATPGVIATQGVTAAVHFPNGYFMALPDRFDNGIFTGPFYLPANSEQDNGVFYYGVSIGYPSNSYNTSYYGTDVLFVPDEE